MNKTLKIFLYLTFVILITESFQADTSICLAKNDIYSSSGKLLKRICFANSIDSTYDGAEKFCRNHGMQPFVVNNEDVARGLLNELKLHTEQFAPACTVTNWPDSCIVGINGRRSSNGKWYTYTHEVLPLYENFSWINGSEFGNCLTVKIRNGKLAYKGDPCEQKNARFCEYDVTDENLDCQHKLNICKNALANLLN
ncbi:hypothetical protein PVAND_000245 [Polypedilum vanderplanki]|uniref:C-type lectin domain-containing protein n=1 Tax=Polypedilum vanderplanki TaxID=319348 RepID=A0A9J6BJE2_POLVA|nr:hypothetical protein PVAND_000245 [Polypedilum vanderplanki]